MQNYVRAQRREHWQNEQQKGLWNECKGSLALIVVSEELQGADQRQRCLAFRNAMRWAALEQRHDAGVSPVDSRKGARPSALKRATSSDPAAGCAGFSPRGPPGRCSEGPFQISGYSPSHLLPSRTRQFLVTIGTFIYPPHSPPKAVYVRPFDGLVTDPKHHAIRPLFFATVKAISWAAAVH
jgi:hypothetical protein